jgi:SAM-dependent methyltransferase
MRKIGNLEYQVRQLMVRRVAPLLLRAVNRSSEVAETRLRRSLAVERHARGKGIEVGAAASPAIVPLGCQVTYVDKYDADALRSDPELTHLRFRGPDIVDKAETLSSIPTATQDFVLAFSVLEHVQDPLAALQAFTRVLRPGGRAIVSVPDKRRYAPDMKRPTTPFAHFVRDFREGPGVSVREHFEDVGRTWHGLAGAELEGFVQTSVERDGHCHFHVWDAEGFIAFALAARDVIDAKYEILETASYGVEVLLVLTKDSAAA